MWAAWNGARLVAVAGKAGSSEIAHLLGCERLENLSDAFAFKAAIGRSRSVPPARLLELCALAFESCRELYQAALSATAALETQSARPAAKATSSLGAYAERICEFFGWREVANVSAVPRQRR